MSALASEAAPDAANGAVPFDHTELAQRVVAELDDLLAATPADATHVAGKGPVESYAPPELGPAPRRRRGGLALGLGLGVAIIAVGLVVAGKLTGLGSTPPPPATHAARGIDRLAIVVGPLPKAPPLPVQPPALATATTPEAAPAEAAPATSTDAAGAKPASTSSATAPAAAGVTDAPRSVAAADDGPAPLARAAVDADCLTDDGEVDRRNCPDPALVAADRAVSRAYRQAMRAGIPPEALEDQRNHWRTIRQYAAGRSRGSLLEAYRANADELEEMAAAASGDPAPDDRFLAYPGPPPPRFDR